MYVYLNKICVITANTAVSIPYPDSILCPADDLIQNLDIQYLSLLADSNFLKAAPKFSQVILNLLVLNVTQWITYISL